jgi:hypothetical protein
MGYRPGQREPSYSRTEVWTSVHAAMAIVCASLPVYRPLVKKISDSSFVSKLSSFSFRHHRYSSGGWSLMGRSESRRSGMLREENMVSPELELGEVASREQKSGASHLLRATSPEDIEHRV